jgi:hypothetical protein
MPVSINHTTNETHSFLQFFPNNHSTLDGVLVTEATFTSAETSEVSHSLFSFLQLWTGGGPRGRLGRHADRTVNTIAAEVARVPRPVTAGNTVRAGT